MKREQLEHVLRAAARIVNQSDFLVIGSAAILATYDDAALPYEASRSDEADLAPFDDDATGTKSFQVEGSLGQGSPFHETFGYYADGVDFRTAAAPEVGKGGLSPLPHRAPSRVAAGVWNATTSRPRSWPPGGSRTTSSWGPSWTPG